MQDSRNIEGHPEATTDDEHADAESVVDADDPSNEDGWQQYRRWISKTPSPKRRRTGLDPALYTWKGYRNWAKQVKRNWSDN